MKLTKNILLGVTGGIACYKAAELVRLLRAAGATVQVVMTESAKQFITPLTMQALSGRPVRDTLFGLEAEHAMSHIELARWADLVLIAPATANCIAKLAQGLADDLLTTLCLATQAPLFIAPAMNQRMWHHPATQRNLQTLRATVLGPGVGEQACGDVGEGRLLEPLAIVQAIIEAFPGRLRGHTVMITAGPTREALDPARCFTNFSSGKMGYALAEAAVAEGARVILISGPTALLVPHGVECIAITTAQEMLAAVEARLSGVTLFIGAAAVADYRPMHVAPHKIKKGQAASMTVEMIRNPDILQTVASSNLRPACVVGFAAESERVVEHATQKLQQKGLDWIVANAINEGEVFGSDQNQGWFIAATGEVVEVPRCSKQQFSRKLLNCLYPSIDGVETVCYDPTPYS